MHNFLFLKAFLSSNSPLLIALLTQNPWCLLEYPNDISYNRINPLLQFIAINFSFFALVSYCATFYVSDIVLDVLVNEVVDRKGGV